MALAETSQRRRAATLNLIAHAAFVPAGIVTVLLGPLLPALSAQWSLNYAQAGSLFTAQFAGGTLGTFLSGMVASRFGFRFAVSAGLFAMATGVGALPFSSHPLGLICIFCYGAGLGCSIPAANLLVAAINPNRSGAALSLLNLSWSAGAVACPFMVAAAARAGAVKLLLTVVAAALLMVVVAIEASSKGIDQTWAREENSRQSLPANRSRGSVLMLSALFFLYVGAENAFGGWIASYSKSLGTSSSTLAVMTPSFFYAALMAGRCIAPLVLEKFDETKTARAGLCIACAGMAGLVFSRTMPLVASSVAVAGFGLAAVYPITISRLSQEFGHAAARVGSITFTVANLGGASLPWLVGYSSHRFHDLRVGLVVPLAATLVMYILYRRPGVAHSRRAKRLSTREDS